MVKKVPIIYSYWKLKFIAGADHQLTVSQPDLRTILRWYNVPSILHHQIIKDMKAHGLLVEVARRRYKLLNCKIDDRVKEILSKKTKLNKSDKNALAMAALKE